MKGLEWRPLATQRPSITGFHVFQVCLRPRLLVVLEQKSARAF